MEFEYSVNTVHGLKLMELFLTEDHPVRVLADEEKDQVYFNFTLSRGKVNVTYTSFDGVFEAGKGVYRLGDLLYEEYFWNKRGYASLPSAPLEEGEPVQQEAAEPAAEVSVMPELSVMTVDFIVAIMNATKRKRIPTLILTPVGSYSSLGDTVSLHTSKGVIPLQTSKGVIVVPPTVGKVIVHYYKVLRDLGLFLTVEHYTTLLAQGSTYILQAGKDLKITYRL